MQGQAKSAIFLLRSIQQKTLDPKTLTPHQKRVCIRYFLEEQPGMTQEQMGEVLATPQSWVSRFMSQIKRQDGWIVDRLDPRSEGADYIRATRARIKKLEQKEKWESAHRLHTEMLETLMEMGLLHRAPVEVKGEVSFKEIVKLAAGHRDEIADILRGDGRGLGCLNN